MARLIFICPYIKGNATYRSNHVNYIATREGVEIQTVKELCLPTTENRNVLIEEIQNEYISFEEEQGFDNSEKRTMLVNYIANRPGVQKLGTNGLFSVTDEKIVLSQVRKEIAEHGGNVWIPIFSLTREDAEQFGFDNAEAWKNLLRAHSTDIAECLKIHPDNLRWYAAYHDKDTHPHVHMVIYSTESTEGFLTKTGIRQIKSSFANDIFKPEMLEYFSRKSEYRHTLNEQAHKAMEELTQRMETGEMRNEKIELLMINLSDKLKCTNGKKQYGYLSPKLKSVVDEITDELAGDARVSEAYMLWHEMQNAVTSIYTDNLPTPLPLSQQKEFKPIRNMIIREAVAMSEQAKKTMLEGTDCVVEENEIEDQTIEQTEASREVGAKQSEDFTPLSSAVPLFSSATRLLHNMGNIFREVTPNSSNMQHIDRKRKRELAQKRREQGVKGNNFEQRM